MDYLARRLHLLDRLDAAGIETLLVSRVTNIRYLTGFSGTAAYLLFSRDPLLMVDFRYDEQARREVAPVLVDGTASPPGLWSRVCALAHERNQGAVAIEARIMPVAQGRELRGAVGRDIVETANLVEDLREIKEPEEQQLIREASAIADRVFTDICKMAAPGMIENDVAGEIERLQRRLGSERSAASLIVASGHRSSLPHGAASNRVMANREPLMIDLSPVVGGYRADLTRTVHLGAPSAEFIRIYGIVRDALEFAKEGVRAGVPAASVDAIARGHIADAGFGAYFNHSLGHGIGLDQHEGPLLSPTGEKVLAPGMAITVEPGIYIPGVGGVRIEDAVLVTEDGCDVLNTSSRELVTL